MNIDPLDPTTLRKDIHLTTWPNGSNHVLLMAEPLGYTLASYPHSSGAFGQDQCVIHHPAETVAIREHLVKGLKRFADAVSKGTRWKNAWGKAHVSFVDHAESDSRFKPMVSIPLEETWAVANGVDPCELHGSISFLSEFREQAAALI